MFLSSYTSYLQPSPLLCFLAILVGSLFLLISEHFLFSFQFYSNITHFLLLSFIYVFRYLIWLVFFSLRSFFFFSFFLCDGENYYWFICLATASPRPLHNPDCQDPRKFTRKSIEFRCARFFVERMSVEFLQYFRKNSVSVIVHDI